MRVVCAGHVNWDVTIRVDSLPAPDAESVVRGRRESGGGSAANVAAALADLGATPSLLGSVGGDDHGARARQDLAAAVDTDPLRVVEGRTAVKYLLVDEAGEVAVLDDGGANEAVDPGSVPPDLFEGAAVCHLTGQRPDTAARLAELASEAGATVSFDPGRRLGGRDYAATLELCDLVFLNAREAERLPSMPADCRAVRKRGSAGRTSGGRSRRRTPVVPSPPPLPGREPNSRGNGSPDSSTADGDRGSTAAPGRVRTVPDRHAATDGFAGTPVRYPLPGGLYTRRVNCGPNARPGTPDEAANPQP